MLLQMAEFHIFYSWIIFIIYMCMYTYIHIQWNIIQLLKKCVLEKEMATHSSVLAWRIPGTGEPGGLPSVGLHRVGHDWSDLAAAAAYMCIYTLSSSIHHRNAIQSHNETPHTYQNGYHQKSTNNKCWQRYREKGIFVYSCWKSKLMQPLWNMVWGFFNKPKI